MDATEVIEHVVQRNHVAVLVRGFLHYLSFDERQRALSSFRAPLISSLLIVSLFGPAFGHMAVPLHRYVVQNFRGGALERITDQLFYLFTESLRAVRH
jgi:hypothetical protein